MSAVAVGQTPSQLSAFQAPKSSRARNSSLQMEHRKTSKVSVNQEQTEPDLPTSLAIDEQPLPDVCEPVMARVLPEALPSTNLWNSESDILLNTMDLVEPRIKECVPNHLLETSMLSVCS